MQRDLGITFVHVTHTQLEAIALADMVVVMEQGKIKQAGPARDVYDQPQDRYVAEFLGGQNVLRGQVRRSTAIRRSSRRPRCATSRCRSAPGAVCAAGDDVDCRGPARRRRAGARRTRRHSATASTPSAIARPRHRVPGQFRQGPARRRSAATSSSPTCRTGTSTETPSPSATWSWPAGRPRRRGCSPDRARRAEHTWDAENRNEHQRHSERTSRSTIDVEPSLLLVATCSRETLDLTGTHVGCDTSAVRRLRRPCRRRARSRAARCSRSPPTAPRVTTIEGLAATAGKKGSLHPMQEAFHSNHGLQCGFCTPGMVMSAVDFAQRNPAPTEARRAALARGQHLPLHRLPEHRHRRPCRDGRDARRRGGI